ncbi:MAG: adenylate cyclase [Planctomycetia bacterium 21-64-5]|nr:MAG: adenylate cyclase [Planctomycetia bacterium 21-64-5]HQU43953.1 FHA domain-containing protein [Pirellulales bacterium]
MYGELIPLGGGDPIPLRKKSLLVGRRESCDIVLRFPNVSAHHCQLTLLNGYWYVHDLQSRNGVKVNNLKVTEKRIDPGDTLAVAKHRYEIHYSPADLGAVGPPPTDGDRSEIFQKSLLERAGLLTKDPGEKQKTPLPSEPDRRRYNILDDSQGQIRDPNKPV